ncbi:MAG: carbonic anhydrase [Candidatus Micrarchaeota archaeon]
MEFKELLKRNENFVKTVDKKKLAELSGGQKPHTIVLTCSDSRVVPEFIFGCELGELFVVRVAGNVACDCDVLASVEYAAEHLGTKNLLVLGHTKCGAVCAACKGGNAEGNIAGLLSHIKPAVEKACGHEEAAIEENVRLQMKNLKEKSEIIMHLAHEGKLSIFGAIYDISSGKVRALLG